MPAPSIQALYDFETQLEGAFAEAIQDFLDAIPITCSVETSRASALKDTPEVEVIFSLGSSLNQRTTIGQANPKIVPNAFTGTLTVSVTTTREDANDASHGPIRGAVRYVMSGANEVLSEIDLPYLQILDLQPAGSAPAVNEDKAQDITAMTYTITFAIRDDAWPATV